MASHRTSDFMVSLGRTAWRPATQQTLFEFYRSPVAEGDAPNLHVHYEVFTQGDLLAVAPGTTFPAAFPTLMLAVPSRSASAPMKRQMQLRPPTEPPAAGSDPIDQERGSDSTQVAEGEGILGAEITRCQLGDG